jgi:hypothetical protein
VWTEAEKHFWMLVPELRMAAAEQRNLVQKSPHLLLIGLAFAANLILILIYPVAAIMHELEWISFDKAAFRQYFSVSSDGSIPEVAGYLQLAIAAAAMAVLAIKSRARTYFAWVVVLAYAIADDSLLIHETAGARLAKLFPPAWGAQAPHVGELIYFAMTAVPLTLLFAYSYSQSEWKHRARSLLLLVPFGTLALFAIVIDYFHERLHGFSRVVDFSAGMIEDASELLCMAMIMLFAIALVTTSVDEHVRLAQGNDMRAGNP